METSPYVEQDTNNENKEVKESLLKEVSYKLINLTRSAADFLTDISSASNYFKDAPFVVMQDSPLAIAFIKREFNEDPTKDVLYFKDNNGRTYNLLITPVSEMSSDSIESWKNYGFLPSEYIASLELPAQKSVTIHVKKEGPGRISVKHVSLTSIPDLQLAFYLLDAGEKSLAKSQAEWKASDSTNIDQSDEKIFELYPDGGIILNN